MNTTDVKKTDNIITLEHVTFQYNKEEGTPVQVLKDISLDIQEGSFVAVLGHNGCGKSTLAKHMNAILLPSGGTVYVGGIDTRSDEQWMEVRRTVGMVFQNPDNQIVSNVVEEDVAFAPENLGVPTEEIRRRVDKALEIVGMSAYSTHAPHLLSGGQKQRVAIAGIIAMEPKCIVLDEPTAMLDPKGRKDVIDTVKKLNKEKGITVILITHHMDEAAQAGRVVVLNKGKIAADGTPREVFSQVKLLHDIGLAAPEGVELCWALNQKGFQLPLTALEPEECAQVLYDWVKT